MGTKQQEYQIYWFIDGEYIPIGNSSPIEDEDD